MALCTHWCSCYQLNNHLHKGRQHQTFRSPSTGSPPSQSHYKQQFSYARWLHQFRFQMILDFHAPSTAIPISIWPYLDQKQQLVTTIKGRHVPWRLSCNWYGGSILASQKSINSPYQSVIAKYLVLYLQLLLGCLLSHRMWLGMGLWSLMAVWTEYQEKSR